MNSSTACCETPHRMKSLSRVSPDVRIKRSTGAFPSSIVHGSSALDGEDVRGDSLPTESSVSQSGSTSPREKKLDAQRLSSQRLSSQRLSSSPRAISPSPRHRSSPPSSSTASPTRRSRRRETSLDVRRRRRRRLGVAAFARGRRLRDIPFRCTKHTLRTGPSWCRWRSSRGRRRVAPRREGVDCPGPGRERVWLDVLSAVRERRSARSIRWRSPPRALEVVGAEGVDAQAAHRARGTTRARRGASPRTRGRARLVRLAAKRRLPSIDGDVTGARDPQRGAPRRRSPEPSPRLHRDDARREVDDDPIAPTARVGSKARRCRIRWRCLPGPSIGERRGDTVKSQKPQRVEHQSTSTRLVGLGQRCKIGRLARRGFTPAAPSHPDRRPASMEAVVALKDGLLAFANERPPVDPSSSSHRADR